MTTAVAIFPSRRPVDVAAAADAVAQLLTALGQDPTAEHLRDTPRRVVRAYAELLTPLPF